MSCKRIIGIIALVAGIILIFASMYIRNQVEEGKYKANRAQSKVGAGNRLFSSNPASKKIGEHITNPMQRKIDAGRRDIAYYENMARGLQIAGIVLIIFGIIFILIGKKRKRS